MAWIKLGDKPCTNCQNAEQRRNNWKGSGCRYCNWTGLQDVGYQS
jgi:hypothetical protein